MLNGYGTDSPERMGRYSIATPQQPSNPLGMFAANFAKSFVNSRQDAEKLKSVDDYKNAFLQYQQAKTDPNNPMNAAKINNLNARTGNQNTAADKLRMLQDQNTMKDLVNAETKFTNYVNNFVKSGLGGLPADPTNPKVQQLTQQATQNYAKMVPDDMTLISNAHYIRADIMSRNPTLNGLTQNKGDFNPKNGAQNAIGAPPPQGSAPPPRIAPYGGLPPLPGGANPPGHPQGMPSGLPAVPGAQTMGPMPGAMPNQGPPPPQRMAQAQPMTQGPQMPPQAGGNGAPMPQSSQGGPQLAQSPLNPNLNGLGDNPSPLLNSLNGQYGLG